MKNRPLIGVTPQYNTKKEYPYSHIDYLEAVSAAGGLPLVLPIRLNAGDAEQLAETLDGVLFTGGPDIAPYLYGEIMIKECGEQCPLRDEMELGFARAAAAAGLPILGLCRGVQTINVAFGGALYQDIPSQYRGDTTVLHSQSHYVESGHPSHTVWIDENSELYEIIGKRDLLVNSFHHQAVKIVAPDMRVTARAEDGLIECLESRGNKYILGVQWHPERMFRRDKYALALFENFVKKCGNH